MGQEGGVVTKEGVAERLQSILKENRKIDLAHLKSSFAASEQWILEIHLANLIDKGTVVIKGKGDDMTFALRKHPDLLPGIQAGIQINAAAPPPSYSIVATLPESLLSVTPSLMQTRTSMRTLFSSVRREILVSEPFIDNTFVDIYEDEIREMAKRGVKLVLLTRKVATDTPSIRPILRIFEIYSMQGQKTKFELYEHWIPLRIGQEQARQFVGLHAKLIIAEDAAYIGSANWTGFSLSNNVELGMMVRDAQMVHQLREVYSFVVTQSTKVDIERIHQKLVYKARDQHG
jgi:phosphatidylserine/phosphatidylglycerophosphate/cardiolipin synthase-like enzyme